MSDAKLDRIREAWRQASPADIIKALNEAAEYEPHVIAIVRKEAERRGLSADSDEALPPPTYESLRSVATPVADRLRDLARHGTPGGSTRKLIVQSLTLVGLYFLGGAVLDLLGVWPLAWVLYVVGLFVMCRPLRDCRTAVLAPLIAGGTIVMVVALVTVLMFDSRSIMTPMSWDLIAAGVAYSVAIHVVAPAVLLVATVFARNRFWPVPQPGHCRVCNYNLYGLPESRCPECGTPFKATET